MHRTRAVRIARIAALSAAIAIPALAQTQTPTPNFIVGYSLQPLNNAVALANGATITFPATQVGNTATGSLIIANSGTGPGTVTSVTVTGAAFNTQSLPLLPVSVAAGGQLTIPLIYAPSAAGSDTGTLQVVAGGRTFSAVLAGSGISAQLTYQVSEGGQSLSVNPGGAIPVPDTPVGGSSLVSVTVTNGGSMNASVTAVQTAGSGYQITSAPPLPLNLLPAASASVTLTYTPTGPGISSGALTIGSAVFALAGRALGPLFQYSYLLTSGRANITPGGSLYFPQAAFGQSSPATFTVTNSGTATGSIAGIYLNGQNPAFALTGLPAFPLTLGPGQSASFEITFTPAASGGASTTMNIDGAQFVLAGSAAALPPAPAYSITGASGTLAPLQQVSLGLSLASAYPLSLSGTLSMAVVPQGFSADPAIQFSTGGRIVAFTIPANSTSAVFGNGSTSVKMQTGSTAGSITVAPAFQTSGGTVLTPAGGSPLQVNVPAAPPVIIGAQMTAQTATGITLAITGVTNTQTLSHLDFQFTPASGYSLKAPSVTLPVSAAATAFFGSTAAQNFGGQFVASVPFNFSTGGSSTNALQPMKSVAITATNDQGTSSVLNINLQ